jgi:hypothetical protein
MNLCTPVWYCCFAHDVSIYCQFINVSVCVANKKGLRATKLYSSH